MPAQVDAARPSGDLRAGLPSQELVVEGLDARVRIDVAPAGSPLHAHGALIERDAQGQARIVAVTGDAQSDLVIALPLGTALTLHAVTGWVTIGDTCGALTLRLGDGCRVRAGRVASADVRIDGDSVVSIADVEGGSIAVDVTGAGRVQAAGAVRRFASNVHGAGDVLLHGCADEACLTVEGSGHIGVTRVRRGLASLCVGSGGIDVSFPPSPAADRSAVIFDGVSAALAGR